MAKVACQKMGRRTNAKFYKFNNIYRRIICFLEMGSYSLKSYSEGICHIQVDLSEFEAYIVSSRTAGRYIQ